MLLLVALANKLQAASCRALAVQIPSCTPVAWICNGSSAKLSVAWPSVLGYELLEC
jgi:hypothetical protein